MKDSNEQHSCFNSKKSIKNKKRKVAGSQPGLPESTGFGLTCLVNWVSPGQLPGRFLLSPGPVPSPGRPGPGSTCRADPGFKTMVLMQ